MPVLRLHLLFEADGAFCLAERQRAGLWRSRADSSTPQSPVALGHGLCCGQPAPWGAVLEAGLPPG